MSANDRPTIFTNYSYCEKLKNTAISDDGKRWIAMYALDIVHMLTKEYNGGQNEYQNLSYKAEATSTAMAYFKDQSGTYVPELQPQETVDLLNAQIGYYATNLLHMDRDWSAEMANMERNAARRGIQPRTAPTKRDPHTPDGTGNGIE